MLNTAVFADEDSLPSLKDNAAPTTIAEMWSGYDPAKEPLDIEVCKEWKQDGVVLRVIRYRIGVFHGQKSMMAGIYGFPEGGSKLPALLQMHGGGQSANANVVLTNAKRGYACLSINWGGNPLGGIGDYTGPNTDWGAVDPTQKGHNDHYGSTKPDARTLDSVDSPRNDNWFLITVGARRALTFLAQQPEVDPNRLGIYGHSMGGNLTLYVAASDGRVKAAAPSSGAGIGDMSGGMKNPVFNNQACAAIVTSPILFVAPADDFHGSIVGVEKTWDLVKSKEVRICRAPHLNHRAPGEFVVPGLLWMDQWLKGSFTMPQTPGAQIELGSGKGNPTVVVTPDPKLPLEAVDVYYSQNFTDEPGYVFEHEPNRYWRHASALKDHGKWIASLPAESSILPIWAFANVRYALKSPLSGAGFYYGVYSTDHYSLSSRLVQASAEQIATAHVPVTFTPSLTIESFAPGWEKEWYSFDDNSWVWPWHTHKLSDMLYQPPAGASLAVDVDSPQANSLIVQVGDFAALAKLTDGKQTVTLAMADFVNVKTGETMQAWKLPAELSLGPSINIQKYGTHVPLGDPWQGPAPTFKDLRWVTAK